MAAANMSEKRLRIRSDRAYEMASTIAKLQNKSLKAVVLDALIYYKDLTAQADPVSPGQL